MKLQQTPDRWDWPSHLQHLQQAFNSKRYPTAGRRGAVVERQAR
jgi:hypothetical protein